MIQKMRSIIIMYNDNLKHILKQLYAQKFKFAEKCTRPQAMQDV